MGYRKAILKEKFIAINITLKKISSTQLDFILKGTVKRINEAQS